MVALPSRNWDLTGKIVCVSGNGAQSIPNKCLFNGKKMVKHTYIQTSIRMYVRHTSIHTYKLQRMQKHHGRKPSPSMWLQSPSWARTKTYGTPKVEGRLMNIMYPERTYLGKGGICWVHIVWGGFVLIWGLDSSLITFGHYEIVITHSVKIIVNGNHVIIHIYIYNYVYIYIIGLCPNFTMVS